MAVIKKKGALTEITLLWPSTVPIDHISVDFIEGMVSRMAFGFHNYGHVKENFPEPHDALACMRLRLKKYRETRNTEWLMDAANYAMIEFAFPKLPRAFFSATSSRESPGSVLRNGKRDRGKAGERPDR